MAGGDLRSGLLHFEAQYSLCRRMLVARKLVSFHADAWLFLPLKCFPQLSGLRTFARHLSNGYSVA